MTLNFTAAQPQPTVVLVHGAFADSSSWNGVVERLAAAGHPVIAAANPLRGLGADAAYLRSLLDSVAGPIVLAGHSYGGPVMSEAADGHPNVKPLVYIASFLLEEGESTALEEPASRAAWKGIPSWNMVTTQDLAIPPESMRFMGHRAQSHTVEVAASHAVTVSRPDVVADLICTAAGVTAR